MQFNLRPRSLLTTLAELAGFGLVTTGVWQIYAPAGWITAGLSLIATGVSQAQA